MGKKHLLINAATWRLPAETDLKELAKLLADTVAAGKALTIDVELEDNPLGRGLLTVNGANVVSVAVIDVPEPGSS